MAEELVNNSHRQMKEEEGRRIAAVETFSLTEKGIQELNTKLTKADRERKSAEAAFYGAKKQEESQYKQSSRSYRRSLYGAKDQLFAAREQIEVLKRLRKPLKMRSLEFVGPTAFKYGTRPSTKLEWRPSLP